MLKTLRSEAQAVAIWLTAALFLLFGRGWLTASASSANLTLALFVWLFAAGAHSASCAMPNTSPRRWASPTAR
jgi:hypothetical protein